MFGSLSVATSLSGGASYVREVGNAPVNQRFRDELSPGGMAPQTQLISNRPESNFKGDPRGITLL